MKIYEPWDLIMILRTAEKLENKELFLIATKSISYAQFCPSNESLDIPRMMEVTGGDYEDAIRFFNIFKDLRDGKIVVSPSTGLGFVRATC